MAATRQAAAAGLHELAWKLPVAAMSFFHRRTHWADWVDTHQIGLASARALGDRRGEALVLNNLGMAFARRRMDEAAGYFEQALAIRREIGDLPGEAQTATNLADNYVRLERYDEALDLLKRALEIRRQAANPYSEAVVLNNLGEAYLALGRITEAVAEPRAGPEDLPADRGDPRRGLRPATISARPTSAWAGCAEAVGSWSARWTCGMPPGTGWMRRGRCGCWGPLSSRPAGPTSAGGPGRGPSPCSRPWRISRRPTRYGPGSAVEAGGPVRSG